MLEHLSRYGRETYYRIMTKVSVNRRTGCWEFTGAGGRRCHYGSAVYVHNGAKKMHPTHRIMWMLFRGDIPQGMYLDHIGCRNKPCCNPSHLRVVEPYVNAMENNLSPIARHGRKTECPKCGGPFVQVSTRRRTFRRCEPCNAKAKKAYQATPEARMKHVLAERARRARIRATDPERYKHMMSALKNCNKPSRG